MTSSKKLYERCQSESACGCDGWDRGDHQCLQYDRRLSKKQLKDIFTGKISSWDAAGGSGGKIVVVSRDSASGTFEAFAELALDKQKVRADAMMAASNQAVAAMVAQTPGAIGYVGLAYMSNKGTKAIEIDGVVASSTSVLNKSYKLSRPLFMYTNGKPSGLAKDFIDFI
jgi:phosphate transport system substrate-binding protein